MPNIIYSASAGNNDVKLGKLIAALRTVIEFEADAKTKDDILSSFYNVEESNKWAEAIAIGDEFGMFTATPEGGDGEADSMADTGKKVVEHVAWLKNFTITKQMVDDANFGVSADATHRAQAFMRAYKQTRLMLGIAALTQAPTTKLTGTEAANNAIEFNGAKIDVTTADGLPLFSNAHTYGATTDRGGHGVGTQSNYLGYKKAAAKLAQEEFLEMLGAATMQIRNMKDENGQAMGYVADTILLPGNNYNLETVAKRALASEYNPSNDSNAVNIQYGNWKLIILPQWQVSDDKFIVMSSEANKNLSGNMFYNRTPLTIRDEIATKSFNLIVSGYSRFGVGFGSYKHATLVQAGTTAPTGATLIS
jgi:hypothetical protein